MGSFIDLTGKNFGRLTVIGRSDERHDFGALWNCVCECGVVKSVFSTSLRTGNTKSCGCHRREVLLNLTHGQSTVGSRTYRTWKEMRQRCMNPNNGKWKWYGGRGISITPSWDSFETFLADMGERPENCSIDRIDVHGNYEPENCRWATVKQQAETNRGVIKPGSIPHNKIQSEVLLIMRAMRDSGAKLREISAATGVNITTVCKKLRPPQK